MFPIVNICYLYDGSFEGFLSCVFESYARRETPVAISAIGNAPLSLWEERYIETDAVHAQRVFSSLSKISTYVEHFIGDAFLTCLAEKELRILEFLYLAYKVGAKALDMLADPRVDVLQKAVLHLSRESQRLMGFVRFSIFGESLVAVIEPRNFVLPRIAGHFCNRYNSCNFLIYDKTHKSALIYVNGTASFKEIDDFVLPEADLTELEYRKLWKAFYETIAIEGRKNERCRMNMMPKRYWGHMLEVEGELLHHV